MFFFLFEYIYCFFTIHMNFKKKIVFENKFFNKNQGYSGETVGSITRKIPQWHIEFCYKNIFKIPSVMIIFQYFGNTFQKRQNNWNNSDGF